jgi:NAD(P)H-hydrate epimerase
MQGAAMLAGLGAARAGAGLIVIAHDSQQTPHAPYEFVLRAVNTASPDEVFGDCSAVVIGPGLGRHAERWMQWLRGYQGTAVIDAEALAVFADGVPPAPRPWVLTPHPKEAGRLLGWETAEVQANRVRAVRTLAERTGAVAVLKGYRSLIATPDGRIRVNPTGDASLATAGTGDVLAGVIGALLAQGLDPFDAAAAGVWLHGCAGELAGQSTSKASTMASDVVEHISRAIRRCFDTHPGDLDR